MSTPDRFVGSILAGAVGDALGAHYEWHSHQQLIPQFPKPQDVFKHTDITSDFLYTDDSQMTIGVAECLIEHGEIKLDQLSAIFYRNYETWRGYGKGVRAIMAELGSGTPASEAANVEFYDGSYGNGSAMRVAPIGLFYQDQPELLASSVKISSCTTHTHPLAIEGAHILATGIAHLAGTTNFDRDQFFDAIMAVAKSREFIDRLNIAAEADSFDDLVEMGSDITAYESVPTAIACFSLMPHSYQDCIGSAIRIGGDTDTVSSMSGHLFGALNGETSVPINMLEAMDRDCPQRGSTYMRDLALKLWDRFEKSQQ